MNLSLIQSTRTNNFNDDLVLQKITELWKVASSKLADHHDSLYGLYHDYESDYKGDYTLSVAIKTTEEAADLSLSENEKYEIFNVDTTDEQGVFKAWQKIWHLEESGELKRAYSYDYEEYQVNGDINIYIAIK
ncbi:effector binding domain-containing protein [Salipaludibacillus agaradhaerens]|uniref:effector binding domain-containing protein n=1 Tax=Salipaludibacillus agaradhaerens TaxID=76935 RepID=UPI0021507F4B|nr:effector binding domain-containing protein [Salipaludibacillus agaradhaerens]MCR6105912.1 effector binding domain-containing protein [Salipaludibacillus agaradhaerens]MCR6117945.1 effector binding domain-containing protein [Salipaludibacillus agaradhaerens]UJW57085.1 effector binding domain-containing protein [Bacillus sp. A116_S68]